MATFLSHHHQHHLWKKMRSDLTDDRNILQIAAAEIAESSDTSGFFEITSNGSNGHNGHRSDDLLQLDNTDYLNNPRTTSRPKRSSRRLQTVGISSNPTKLLLISNKSVVILKVKLNQSSSKMPNRSPRWIRT